MHDLLSSEPVWPPLFKLCPAGPYLHSCINLHGMVFVGLHHFASITNQSCRCRNSVIWMIYKKMGRGGSEIGLHLVNITIGELGVYAQGLATCE